MTLTWTIIVTWLVLQLPLALLIGKSMKLGMRGEKRRPVRLHPAVVWC